MSELDEQKKNVHILFIGVQNPHILQLQPGAERSIINSIDDLNDAISERTPDLIVFGSVQKEAVERIRKTDKLVLVPVLIIADSFEGVSSFDSVALIPRVIICNTCAAGMEQFTKRIKAVIEKKNKILPARTGMIVKYTILFLNNSVGKQITRGKLAERAGVTEDYLTRIFHEEMGLHLWDYLNCYRMDYAVQQLLQTDDTVYEVADKAGFPDAAYFNRVFHKQFGVSPGQVRKTGFPLPQ